MKYIGVKDDQIMLAGISEQSLVNGPGLRKVYFSQGCNHHCKNCFNPETWQFGGGKIISIKTLIKTLKEERGYLDGITFSGGDPVEQADKFIPIAKAAHGMGLNIWSWTGYTWEELMNKAKKEKVIKEYLENIDVLVDGRYDYKLHTEEYKYRGSSNQRIIDVVASLKNKELVVITKFNP